jgi:inosine-uridine nucleoside N-ribohydrolase
MGKKMVWLDCDPGNDDMLAIVMAALSEELELIGISTSAGNSIIQNTTQNALDILYEIGRADIPVVKGSATPLCRKLESAAEYHGELGLEGAVLERSPFQAISDNPFLYLYNAIMGQSDKVEFVVTGAMTNLALLLRTFPDVKQQLSGVTLMGGAIGQGNWSPAAEFNMAVDPEAARMVFKEGLPITMVPLEVTHTVMATEDIFLEF